MRIVSINTYLFGSTGTIMNNLSQAARSAGMEAWVAAQADFRKRVEPDKYTLQIGSVVGLHQSMLLNQLFGRGGTYNHFATVSFLKKLSKIKPDILHLHNIHISYLNFPLLFEWIKEQKNLRVIWTLHDCWSFTGHCPHFIISNCNRWKSNCYQCPSLNTYPKSFIDDSKYMYSLKKKCFLGVKNLTFVTPSHWLKERVKESFLKNYPVKTINNGINQEIFLPRKSDFKKKHNIENKKMLLGVSFDWGYKKGLDTIIELSKILDSSYQIVLVGINRQENQAIPKNIITIPRTNNQIELAQIYTAADVFINPTREDTFPTVNIESLACGTPVVTFNVGGSAEIIDKNCGISVNAGDYSGFLQAIQYIVQSDNYTVQSCQNRAKKFTLDKFTQNYLNLYMS